MKLSLQALESMVANNDSNSNIGNGCDSELCSCRESFGSVIQSFVNIFV